MKLSVLLVGVVYAGMEQMLQDLELIKEIKLNNTDPRQRAFSGTIVALLGLDRIWNYGCWCYFQENYGKGKGAPVNPTDEFCRSLQWGYECAIKDVFDEDGTVCVPWEVEYTSGINLGASHSGDLEAECVSQNAQSCQQYACMVENNFVLQFFASFFDPSTSFDPSPKHDLPGGTFDPAVECQTSAGPKSDRQCCGQYPTRFPFKTLGTQRACCWDQVYDTTLMCCSNDILQFSC